MSASILFRRLTGTSGIRRRVAKPRRRDRPSLEFLEDRAVPATLSNFLTTQHVDLNLSYGGGDWSLSPRDADIPASYAPDDALLYVGAPALTTRPASSAFDFVGVGPGESYYRLPQSQNPNLLYLGFAGYGIPGGTFDNYNPSAESKGRISGTGRWLKVSLVDVKHYAPDGSPGNGVFSVWQSEDFGPNVFMSNADDGISNPNANGLDATDGIGADDALWVVAGGHIHYNFGFTAKGRYEVTVKLSGHLDDGNPATLGAYTESDPITLYFSVGSVGQVQFDAASYSVDEGAGTATVTVNRINGSDGRITVDYAALDGTATAGLDFTGVSGTLTFNDQETQKTITIPIIDDTLVEGDETVNLALGQPGPASIANYVASPTGDNSSMLGGQASAILTIIDNDSLANTPPTISSIADQTTDANTPKVVSFTVGDAETPLAGLIVTATSSNTALVPDTALVLTGSGADRMLTITPTAGQSGTATITVKVQDADGGEASETFVLAVNAANRAPIVRDDSYSVRANGTLVIDAPGLLLNDEDPDGDPLTAVKLTDPAHGTLSLNPDGSFTYTPNPGFSGADSFTYAASDGSQDSTAGTVTINVAANTAPTISPITDVVMDEDGDITITFTIGDAETPPESLTVTRTRTNNTLFSLASTYQLGGAGATRTLRLRPTADRFGTSSFTITVSDGSLTASRTFQVTVNPVWDAPRALPDNLLAIPDTTSTLDVLANDRAIEVGQTFQIQSFTQPAHGLLTLGADAKTLRYTPTPGYQGSDEFAYTVIDNTGATSTAVGYITVAPYMLVDSPTSPQHTDLYYNYVDGEWVLNIKTDARFAGGTLGGSSNPTLLDADEGLLFVDPSSKTTRPANNSFGNFDFIGVPAGADIWMLRESSFMNQLYLGWSTEGTPRGTFAQFASSDPRTPGWTEEWMVIELVGFSGPGQFSAFDSGIGNGPRVWFDTADGINSPSDADAGGNPTDAFWAWQGTHAHMAWVFTAPGRYDIQFRAVGWVNDGQGGLTRVESPITTYHFDVDSESAPGQRLGEAPPLARDDRASASRNGGPISIDVLANDTSSPDPREVLAVTGVTQGAGGVVSIAEGGLGVIYRPNPGFLGTDTFTYTITDEHGGIATATVTVDVQGSNAAPTANDDAYLVGAGSFVTGNVLFNDIDADGDPFTASLATGPAKGTLALNPDGTFLYTPGPAFDGEDSFTYTITDIGGLAGTATVTITAAVPQGFESVLTEGHADVGIAYEDNEWDLHIHDEEHDEEYAPDKALLFVGPQAATVREGALAGPAFDFLGVAPGATFYRLPESVNPELLFLGIGTEEIEQGTFAGGKVTLQLKAVNGPGHFSVWRSGDEGPELLMASADGITGADTLDALEAGHTHVNWGFGAKGRYEITFEATATLPGGQEISSGDVTYYFSVDNRGQVRFDSDSYTVDEGGTVTVTVHRDGGADGPLTVHYAAIGGTAGTGDFDPFEGDLTFADGETVKTLTFSARQDGAVEGDEALSLVLTAPEGEGAILGSPAEAAVTIKDADAPLQVEEVTVNNGAAQRSNIETISVRFSRETNLQALIDSGEIVNAVKVASGSSPVALSPDHYRYDAATRTLTIDLTTDGFGSDHATLLADGRYEVQLDTSLIATTGTSPANLLVDGDGNTDGVHRFGFHRLLGDFDGNAEVGQADVDLFLAHYGGIAGRNGLYDVIFDLTGPDGVINAQDFLELRRRLGRRI